MKIPFFHTFILYTGGGTTTQQENQVKKENARPAGLRIAVLMVRHTGGKSSSSSKFLLYSYGTVSSVSAAAATGKIDWEKCPIHVCLAAIKRVGRYLVHFRKILEAVP